jgi:2-oxoglutarate dehydrogenase E2 component (dihydrolipoamide succinyltransferase)
MGESVTEGTVVRWIRKVGDTVDRDEPLFEISTDKVDAEIPSPAAGVLLEIRVKEGETVDVDTVVAMLGAEGDVVAAEATAGADAAGSSAPETPVGDSAKGDSASTAQPDGSAGVRSDASADARPGASGDFPSSEPVADDGDPNAARDARRRTRSSPLVRNIAAEHGVDLARIEGSGVSGRVTKRDILGYIDERPSDGGDHGPEIPAFRPGESVEVVPMSVMRRKIAEHMIYSRRTSAHVHSVFEIDFTRVAAVRQQKKAEFERDGVKLTYLAFIAKAIADALRAMPVLNASLDGDNVVYKKSINLGVAVALDWGLIVPVIPEADEKSLLGLSRAINDVAERARAKRLRPEEVHGGTFTITNPGSLGTLFGMPIINQPQVAILAVGTIEKRVVVIDDMIAVRPRGYLTLGYDHRLVDGAVADAFMARVKDAIEHWP